MYKQKKEGEKRSRKLGHTIGTSHS